LLCGVGQGVVPAGRVMPESPLLSSSLIPACGSCFQVQSRSRGVKRVEEPGSADRRFCGLRLFHWGELRTANMAVRATPESREQSENVYENKGRSQKAEKPLTRLATLATLSLGRGLLTRFIWKTEVMHETQKSREQSENVYENKGGDREVKEWRSPWACPVSFAGRWT